MAKDEFSHGCEIEITIPGEYSVHEVHIEEYGFEDFTNDLTKRMRSKKSVLAPVDAHEVGAGKSRLTQHLIRTELWPAMFQGGFTNIPEWPWKENTVFYDSDEYQAKYLAPHPKWIVLADDETWTKMLARNAMRGTQKEQMTCFGIGRFLKVIAFLMTPGFLDIDPIVRNTVATHWLHISDSWDGGATVCVLKRCPYNHWPQKRSFWDCQGHIEYPYTFPDDWDEEFEAEKLLAYGRYNVKHQDYRAMQIERLRKQEEYRAKQFEERIAKKAAVEQQKRERSSKRERKESTEGKDIAALEQSKTIPLLFNK